MTEIADTTDAYARFNIKLSVEDGTAQDIAELQELLYGAAIWGGAEDIRKCNFPYICLSS
jgi:hypothetical protein